MVNRENEHGSIFGDTYEGGIVRHAGGAVAAGLLVLLAKVLLDLAIHALVEGRTIAGVEVIRVRAPSRPASCSVETRLLVARLDLELFAVLALELVGALALVVPGEDGLRTHTAVLAGLYRALVEIDVATGKQNH